MYTVHMGWVWTDYLLCVYKSSLSSSGQLQHFIKTKNKSRLFLSLNFIFLFLYFNRSVTSRFVQIQYSMFLPDNALLALTLSDIQEVLGWLFDTVYTAHKVILSVNTLKVSYKQCVCARVYILVHGDDCSDHCIFVQLLPSGYNVDKRDTCHIELAYWIPNIAYSFPPENKPTHPPFTEISVDLSKRTK